MRLGAHIYATLHGFEDADSAARFRGRLGDELSARRAAGLLAGFEAGSVSSEEDWDRVAFDPGPLEAFAGGKLPLVFAILSYDADDPRQAGADHGELIRAYRLQLVEEVTPHPAR